jgi:hypothetical protein
MTRSRTAVTLPGLLLACLLLVTGATSGHAADAAAAGLREKAFAALWREDTPRAIACFRQYLALTDGAGDREARRGLALACAWDGRQAEAVTIWRELLATDPGDGEARVGLGRSLLWDNRLRAGWRELRAAAAPGGTARAAADDVQLAALDEYTPPLDVSAAWSWDSDNLDITRLTATGAVHAGGGVLLQVQPGRTWYRQPGQPDADATLLGLGLVTGLGRGLALHAYGTAERYASGDNLPATGAPLAWDRLGGDAWLTWAPAPRWRADLGAASQAVETYLAFGREIERRQASLSLEHRLPAGWSVSLAGTHGDYTDDNRSDLLVGRVGWRRDGRCLWQAGLVGKWLDFRNPYPGGYWAPDWLHSGGLEASLRARRGDCTFRLGGSLAREKEAGAGAITVGAATGRVGWRFAPDWLLGVEAGWSQSSLNTASGYHRTSLGAELRAFF